MALKGKKLELNQNERVKFMISGKSGVGKTFFALDFPSTYFIDTEGGATKEQYVRKLEKSGGVYFGKEEGSQSFDAVIEEVKQLATTKHPYKTLVIDSFSHLYNIYASIAEETVGSDYGKDKKEANRPSRKLLRWLENLDMNVILICHQKDKWERRRKGEKEIIESVGTTFDGFEKLEYILDLWVEIQSGKNSRVIEVKKSRLEKFKKDEIMVADYKKFAEMFGEKNIERESGQTQMASIEQIEKLKKLIEALNVSEEVVQGWHNKIGAVDFEDYKFSQIETILDVLNKKLEGLK